MKKKILFIPMHLSTGGSPQWLYELIKVAMLKNEVFVAEFNNYGSYEIQKNKIINLVGKKRHECIGPTFSDNWVEERDRLWEVIQEFGPDIIHFNEVPENFEYNGFPESLLEKIYDKKRPYKIIETCHSNEFDFAKKVHLPDAYVCVSEYHPPKINALAVRGTFPIIPCYIWDYEIEKKERPDRTKALTKLGLDPDKIHVLNVGLFHENKNQKYIYDIASRLLNKKIQFHFVGNDCYLCNCGIEESRLGLPNCKVWGERSDMDSFYSSMDLFLFPSLRELNPLSVKEALSWDMPVVMNKLESCNLFKKYEDNPSVRFICDIDIEEELRQRSSNDERLTKETKVETNKKDLRIALYTSFYNNSKYISGLYKEIQNQTYKNWKWFVTDDFSKDDTVKKELLRLASEDERVIYCEQKTKKEMFWNPQHFVTEDCDYLALCDADDGIYPKALEFLNHMLKKNPEAFSFSTWFHQYKDDIGDISNVTNSDFSYPQGDWYTYLDKHEEDLKNGDFDWEYLRSFRFFGALRGHKNIEGVEVDINKPEKSVYEDSTRMSILQKYGHYILFPRPMYKVLNHDASHASSHNMDPEEHKVSKDNLYEAIKKGEQYKDNKILNKYYPFFDELCALNISNLQYETERKNICLITNKTLNEEDLENIQDLYFDHNFHVNTFESNIDYFFFNINSFNKEELKEVFDKLERVNSDFEINAYSLIGEGRTADDTKALIEELSFIPYISWNLFCRNITFTLHNKNLGLSAEVKDEKNILVRFGSSSIGDSLAWVPFVEELRKKKGCKFFCSTHRNDLYRESYPEITFVEPGIEIGQFDDENGFVKQEFDNEYDVGWFNSTPLEVKHKNIQYTAAHCLGLDFPVRHDKGIKPRVDVLDKERKIDGKYVCISIHSTAQCKYWNNPEGWNKTVKYLNDLGYKVVCIDKQRRYGAEDAYNDIPEGVIDKTGDFPLQERVTDIYNCEFFIGLGSGLSWLAWGLGKDVVLISGFSNKETEFYTPYRVINENVCNSCWNKHEFDAGDWNWCPEHKDTERHFECSKQITFEMVKKQIEKVIIKKEVYSDSDDWKGVFHEVVIRDVYQKFYEIKKGDMVVDLGSSRGPLYHANRHKDITYFGVEAYDDNVKLFENSLSPEERAKVKVVNRFFKSQSKGEVVTYKGDWSPDATKFPSLSLSGSKDSVSKSINFNEVLEEIGNKKIDFLKFDIEKEEIRMFQNDYDLLLQKANVIVGEVHGVNIEGNGAFNLIKRLKEDRRVALDITAICGTDINEKFWESCENGVRSNFYTEVIIHIKVL